MMEKVYCKDCKHIRKPAGSMYEPHPRSICMAAEKTDYVTGDVHHRECRTVNGDGQCLMFEKESK